MDWLTNEVILYAGIAIVAFTVITAAVYFTISRTRRIRLNMQLEREYGAAETKK